MFWYIAVLYVVFGLLVTAGAVAMITAHGKIDRSVIAVVLVMIPAWPLEVLIIFALMIGKYVEVSRIRYTCAFCKKSLESEAEFAKHLANCGEHPLNDIIASLEKAVMERQSILDFHPRAAKLMRKRKNFVVVAEDERYFVQVYNSIRDSERARGRWTEEDERVYQESVMRNWNMRQEGAKICR